MRQNRDVNPASLPVEAKVEDERTPDATRHGMPCGTSSTFPTHPTIPTHPPPPQRVSEAGRAASLNATLANWNGHDPVWVFAYGSLIWNPELEFDQRQCGVVHGYHRSLCMWSRLYRGTPQAPGLVLALDRGGSCQGVAYRIPAASVAEELTRLWKREMVTGAYEPRWLRVRPCGAAMGASLGASAAGIPHSEHVTALGFVMNRVNGGYAGKLDRDTVIRTVCSARGERGSSAEYLFATVEALAAHGLEDTQLAALADEVAARLYPDGPSLRSSGC